MSEWSTVAVTVDTDDISDDVLELEMWHEDQFYVSRAEITLNNANNEWFVDFNVADEVTIAVDGGTMFVGYLDDIEMKTTDTSVDLNTMVLKCRGCGFYLSNLYFTHVYPDATYSKTDDIIDDALAKAQTGLDGSEVVTYTSPGTAPTMGATFNRTYLLDKFKEMSQQIGYSGYVDNSRALHFFPYGDAAEHTTVDLILDNNVGNSNILRFIWGEQIGYNIRNYVEFYAGTVNDHWTESTTDLDDVDTWEAGTNCTAPVEETLYKLPRGICSIEFEPVTKSSSTEFDIKLDFPQFNYVTLNLSQIGGNSVWFYYEGIVYPTQYKHTRPRLRDWNGTVIEWVKARGLMADQIGPTEELTPYYWNEIKFPQGTGLDIKLMGSEESGFWHYNSFMDTIEAGTDFTVCDIDAVTFEGHAELVFTGGTFVPNEVVSPGMKIIVTNTYLGLNDGTFTVQEVGYDYIQFWEKMTVDSLGDTDIVLQPGFDWTHVDQISFVCLFSALTTEDIRCYIDYLIMPTVQTISIQDSEASSILYKKRMYRESHPEVRSQKVLDALATASLNLGKDPLSMVKVWVDGQTSSIYAGQSLDIQVVPYGISALTKYRIAKLHHKVSRKTVLGGILGYNFVTDYELIEHSVSGETQYTDMYRILDSTNPTLRAVDELKDFRDRLYAEDSIVEVQTYSRVPNDDELRGLGQTGLYADIPATAEVDSFYYCTDTMIWYRWTGTVWVEATRAEVKTRLAQLYERAHGSTSGQGENDHHDKDHRSRHHTVGGGDPIDASSSGAHTHTLDLTDVATTVELTGDNQHNHLLVSWPSALAVSGGAHTHNITGSPTAGYVESNVDPFIEVVSIEERDFMHIVKFTLPEYGKSFSISFPINKPEEGIIKSLKQFYHDYVEHVETSKALTVEPVKLAGKKIRWDKVGEKKHLNEALMDDGLSGWRANMAKAIENHIAIQEDVERYMKNLEEHEGKAKSLGLN